MKLIRISKTFSSKVPKGGSGTQMMNSLMRLMKSLRLILMNHNITP